MRRLRTERARETPTMNMKNGWMRSQKRSPCQGWWCSWLAMAATGLPSNGGSASTSNRPENSPISKNMVKPRKKSMERMRPEGREDAAIWVVGLV